MLAETRPHAFLIDHVHLDAQQILKIHEQPAVIEQRSAGLETNDQIQVRSLGRIPPRHRPEDAHIMRAMPLRQRQNRRTMLSDLLLSHHADIIPQAHPCSILVQAQNRGNRMALSQRRQVLRSDDWLDESLGFAGAEG
jgi:hypothetical protein